VLRWRRLKQRLGTSLLPLIGIYSGYYHLDLSFPTDRVCLKKVQTRVLVYYRLNAVPVYFICTWVRYDACGLLRSQLALHRYSSPFVRSALTCTVALSLLLWEDGRVACGFTIMTAILFVPPLAPHF
jgi:hypothetical protein